MKRLTKLLTTFCSLFAFAAAAQISPVLTNLPDNTAVDLGPIRLTVPNGEFLNQTRQLYANSGMAYDSVRLRALAFGGGHAATNYDSIWALSLHDLTQSELYPPTPAQPTMLSTNYDFTLGAWRTGPDTGPYLRPAARHTVDLILALGDELTTFGMVEGNGGGTQQQLINVANGITLGNDHIFNSYSKIWHYNFVTGEWSYDPTNNTDHGNVWGAVEYDPVSHLVIWADQYHLHTYDPSTHIKNENLVTWVGQNNQGRKANLVDEAGNPVPMTLSFNASLTYNPLDQKMYWFGINKQIWRLDLDRSNYANTKFVKLTYTGTPPPLTNNQEGPVRFDTANGVFGTGPYGNSWYIFDPKTKAWSSQLILGGTPDHLPGGVGSHFEIYSPEANVFIFWTDQGNKFSQSHVWAYRYKTPPAPPPALSFEQKCAMPGVIKCVAFDDMSTWSVRRINIPNPPYAIPPAFNGWVSRGEAADPASGAVNPPFLDTTVRADGAASMRMDFPSLSGQDGGGDWFTEWSNFGTELYGANSDFWIQWKQRFSKEILDTLFLNTGGVATASKFAIITAGDTPPGWPDDPLYPSGHVYASCEKIEISIIKYPNHHFPIAYNECGVYAGFYEKVVNAAGTKTDMKLENGMPGEGCSYNRARAQGINLQPAVDTDGCYNLKPDLWYTITVNIHLGERDRTHRRFANSRFKLWFQAPGEDQQLVVDWPACDALRKGGTCTTNYSPASTITGGTGTEPNTGLFALSDGEMTHPQAYGAIFLLPYMTGKDKTQAHPLASVWYDDLIVSRNPIPN